MAHHLWDTLLSGETYLILDGPQPVPRLCHMPQVVYIIVYILLSLQWQFSIVLKTSIWFGFPPHFKLRPFFNSLENSQIANIQI